MLFIIKTLIACLLASSVFALTSSSGCTCTSVCYNSYSFNGVNYGTACKVTDCGGKIADTCSLSSGSASTTTTTTSSGNTATAGLSTTTCAAGKVCISEYSSSGCSGAAKDTVTADNGKCYDFDGFCGVINKSGNQAGCLATINALGLATTSTSISARLSCSGSSASGIVYSDSNCGSQASTISFNVNTCGSQGTVPNLKLVCGATGSDATKMQSVSAIGSILGGLALLL